MGERLSDRWIRGGLHTAALGALLLCVSGCASEVQHTGRAPEGARRQAAGARRASLLERLNARNESNAANEGSRTTELVEGFEVHGTLSTRLFHRAGCTKLRGIGPRDRTFFTGNFDALDSGYDPCPHCTSTP